MGPVASLVWPRFSQPHLRRVLQGPWGAPVIISVPVSEDFHSLILGLVLRF